MGSRYRTVASAGESAFEVRGSRFYGRVVPVETVAEAEGTIDEVRTDHPDATHVVPAYRVRADPFREWSSDDGEPRGSAGPPALRVLEGQELENVVATVVRYYGGTNLGIGGLTRAYAEAVKGAIGATEVVERRPRVQFLVQTSYDDSGRVRAILESSDASFEASYEEAVTFAVSVPEALATEVRERVLDATSGRAELTET